MDKSIWITFCAFLISVFVGQGIALEGKGKRALAFAVAALIFCDTLFKLLLR